MTLRRAARGRHTRHVQSSPQLFWQVESQPLDACLGLFPPTSFIADCADQIYDDIIITVSRISSVHFALPSLSLLALIGRGCVLLSLMTGMVAVCCQIGRRRQR